MSKAGLDSYVDLLNRRSPGPGQARNLRVYIYSRVVIYYIYMYNGKNH